MQDQTIEQKLDDIFEILSFIKDTAVTKDDLKEFATKDDLKEFATKDDLKELESKMDQGFSSIHTDLNSINLELTSVKSTLLRLEKKMQEDDNAQVREIFDLRARVEKLEKQIRHLHIA